MLGLAGYRKESAIAVLAAQLLRIDPVKAIYCR